jgi:GntR family transcriptional regulator
MDDASQDFLTPPLESQPGIPLRVSVYSRIADAIRGGRLRPGTLVPSESELGNSLGVSRTVVREALMLLEEDGLIRAHRGVGRFVSEHAPRIGMERLRPFEDVLADAASETVVRRVRESLEPTSATFVADGLAIGDRDPSWLWESVLVRDGDVVALLQEHIPAGARLEQFGPEVAAIVESASNTGGSLLCAFVESLGPVFGPGQSEITLGVPGATRGELLGVPEADPVLIVTQSAQYRGRPFYLAKQLLTTGAGQLTVAHAAPSRISSVRT